MPERIVIPALLGMMLDRALAALSSVGLTASVERLQSDGPKDLVVNVTPPAGTRIEPGGTVRMTVNTAMVGGQQTAG